LPLRSVLALTLVCRQIHDETKYLIFERATFYMHDLIDLMLHTRNINPEEILPVFPWSDLLTPSQRAAIRTVRVGFTTMYAASAATMHPCDGSECNRSFERVRRETKALKAVQRVVVELDQAEADVLSRKPQAWAAPLEGVQRCFPGMDVEVVGVEGGWKGTIGDARLRSWGENEEVVFRGRVEGLSESELQDRITVPEGPLWWSPDGTMFMR
jgi:hypothetical protein